MTSQRVERTWIRTGGSGANVLTKFLIIYAKLNLVNVRSAFSDSKINRLPPQGFEHDFNFKKYFTSAVVVDRKSVTMIDTQLDDSVTT